MEFAERVNEERLRETEDVGGMVRIMNIIYVKCTYNPSALL